jgi:hypothetical protein
VPETIGIVLPTGPILIENCESVLISLDVSSESTGREAVKVNVPAVLAVTVESGTAVSFQESVKVAAGAAWAMFEAAQRVAATAIQNTNGVLVFIIRIIGFDCIFSGKTLTSKLAYTGALSRTVFKGA